MHLNSRNVASAADFAICRRMIADGSKSFHTASLLLPPHLRDPAFALYAFCRLSDDAVDGSSGGADPLLRLRRRLDAVYAGSPHDYAPDRALAQTVRDFAIPRIVFDALIEGFAWDLSGRAYETLADVEAYSARVAGSVGAMMAALMGARAPDLLARACDLGVAMQLTNIARDVGEDAAIGRLYLPRQWLRDDGLNIEAWMRAPEPVVAIRAATLRLLDAADALYARADSGVAGLPAACRPAIRAARLIYAEIGAAVRASGGDSVTKRATTSRSRKLALAAASFAPRAMWRGTDLSAPPLAATAYLVDAVASLPVHASRRQRGFLNSADEGWGRVFQLFSDLEYRKRFGPAQ
jgi:phytoene synthase